MFASRRTVERSLAQRLSHAFLLVASLIIVTLALACGSLGLVLGHYQPSIDALLAGQAGVNQIRQGMVDEETGLRGYIDSGETPFLQPYTAGQQEIAAGEAASLPMATHADLAGPLLDMRLAERRWVDEWSTPALNVVGSALTVAQRSQFLLTGKTLFDAYRVAQATVDAQVSADIAAAQASERAVVATGLGLAAVALLATSIISRRQHRALSTALVAPVADLLVTMRRVRDGDLAARPAGIGPPELREVASDLGRMTDALVAERSRIVELEGDARSQAERLQLIVAVGREIAGSLSLRYVSDAVAAAALTISGLTTARIWLTADDETTLTAVHDSDLERSQPIEFATIRLGEGLVGRVGQYGRILSTHPDGSVATEHRGDVRTAALAVPMIVAARVVGVLELTAVTAVDVDEATLDIMRSLAGQGGTAIEAARLHNRADEMSHTDVLTGLSNRRRLETDLGVEVARCIRFRRPLAFVMLDVDHFKDFNDRNGHQVGDEILAEFGRSLADALRETDTAYRYGGEEFSVILRETDPAAALVVAERLRMSIAARFASTDGARVVTASLGIATLPHDADDAASLIAAADRALYAAKAAGRDRVVEASHLPSPRVHGLDGTSATQAASA